MNLRFESRADELEDCQCHTRQYWRTTQKRSKRVFMGMSEPLSKLLVSPLITPIRVPYMIPHKTPFEEFRL